MTEAAKNPVKPKTAKAPAKPDLFNQAPAAKADASGEARSAKTEAKAPAKKAAPAGSTVKLTQLTGTIARKWDQQATLKGLGLGKRHKSSVLKDSPEVRGMINKVRHLVKVENN